MTHRIYTSGFIAAVIAQSPSNAVGILDKLRHMGLTEKDVRFSKDEHDHLEVTLISDRALEIISKLPMVALDAEDKDPRFFQSQGHYSFYGTATYEGVVQNLPPVKQLSHAKWSHIVWDLDAHYKMHRFSDSKSAVDRVAKVA